MNKIAYLAIVTGVAMTLAFSSCATSEVPTTANDVSETVVDPYLELTNQISVLAYSYGEPTNVTDSRGLGKFFKKLIVVACDAVGALVGSSSGNPLIAYGAAAGSSAAAAALIDGNEEQEPSVTESLDVINHNDLVFTINSTCMDSIGLYHNLILSNSFPAIRNSSMSPTFTSIELETSNTIASLCNATPDDIDELNKYYIMYFNTYGNIIANVSAFNSYNDIFFSLSNVNNTQNINLTLLSVLEAFFDATFSSNAYTVRSYYESAIDLVIQSNIVNNQEKEALACAIAVAYASQLYWSSN